MKEFCVLEWDASDGILAALVPTKLQQEKGAKRNRNQLSCNWNRSSEEEKRSGSNPALSLPCTWTLASRHSLPPTPYFAPDRGACRVAPTEQQWAACSSPVSAAWLATTHPLFLLFQTPVALKDGASTAGVQRLLSGQSRLPRDSQMLWVGAGEDKQISQGVNQRWQQCHQCNQRQACFSLFCSNTSFVCVCVCLSTGVCGWALIGSSISGAFWRGLQDQRGCLGEALSGRC